MNIDFTEQEIVELESRGWDCKIKNLPSKYVHFGSDFLNKDKNGEIIQSYSSPTNVDPDDGSYDTIYITWKYETFKDFLQHKHYRKVEETR